MPCVFYYKLNSHFASSSIPFFSIRVRTTLISMMNTNSTRPIVNKTCLCKSAAYPISLTIAVVRKRTELNGNGGFTELPATKVIAIASPIALPVPKYDGCNDTGFLPPGSSP